MMNVRITIRYSAMILIALFLVPLAAVAGPSLRPTARVDPRVLQQTAGANTATFWVILREKANLAPAYTMKNWDARGRFVAAQLQATASRSPAGIRALLQSRNVNH